MNSSEQFEREKGALREFLSRLGKTTSMISPTARSLGEVGPSSTPLERWISTLTWLSVPRLVFSTVPLNAPAPGRGGLLQLLGMALSSCHRYHPAEVKQPFCSAFGCPCCLRRRLRSVQANWGIRVDRLLVEAKDTSQRLGLPASGAKCTQSPPP